jgi:hypothetical protein
MTVNRNRKMVTFDWHALVDGALVFIWLIIDKAMEISTKSIIST